MSKQKPLKPGRSADQILDAGRRVIRMESEAVAALERRLGACSFAPRRQSSMPAAG